MSSTDIENISGIHNYGFNCFLNSVIQCLKFTPSLIKYLTEEEEHDKMILKIINDCDDEEDIAMELRRRKNKKNPKKRNFD